MEADLANFMQIETEGTMKQRITNLTILSMGPLQEQLL